LSRFYPSFLPVPLSTATRDSQKDILKILDALGIEKKSNEAMSSAQSGYGDEFVPTEMASEVIKLARQEGTLFSKIPSGNIIEMPSQPYELPVEGGDPTFYNTSEQTNVTGTAVTTSKAATAKVTLTAAKFSASVYLSGELDDDAKIAGGIQNYVQTKPWQLLCRTHRQGTHQRRHRHGCKYERQLDRRHADRRGLLPRL
jgi:hypothetical protein